MKATNFKKTAIAASVGVAMGSMVSVAQADAVLFPVVQSGNGMATYMQLVNTATIANGAGAVINASTSSSYGENLRFVYNYGTALSTAANGAISTTCTHIDLPGGTSDKDVMLFEATTGSGSSATQLLPTSGAGYAADKSFAPRLTGPIYGSIMVTNAWTGYQPQLTTGAAGVGTGTWAGLSGAGANEGTLFGQAWVVDSVNGTMYGYNALNDPNEATTSAAPNTAATTAFNYNMADQYLFGWAPSYGSTVNTRYWMFPFAATSAYGSTTIPSSVSMVVGANVGNNNNSYNLVSSGQTGIWDHNEGFISGATSISVPCGGVNMPLSAMMSSAHWNIVQYTGGVAHGDVTPTATSNAAGTSHTRNRDAALVYKQISVANNRVVSLVSEPGVRTNMTAVDTITTLTGATAAAVTVKAAGTNIAPRSYTR